MEIGKGKLKGLLREAFISGGRYYIKGHIKENIGKVMDFDTWYNENIVKNLFIPNVVVNEVELVCNRINNLDNNRCINCGAKAGHKCENQTN